MNLTYEIVDIPGWGYGYVVESTDGSFRVYQTTKPGVAGNVKMTRETAEQYALAVITENTAPVAA